MSDGETGGGIITTGAAITRPPHHLTTTGITILAGARRGKRSRRIQQRWKRKRQRKEQLSELKNPYLAQAEENIRKYKEEIIESFGFCADGNLPPWKNAEQYILQLPVSHLHQIQNQAYHNFCHPCDIPHGTKSLIGKGLKFCIKTPRPPYIPNQE